MFTHNLLDKSLLVDFIRKHQLDTLYNIASPKIEYTQKQCIQKTLLYRLRLCILPIPVVMVHSTLDRIPQSKKFNKIFSGYQYLMQQSQNIDTISNIRRQVYCEIKSAIYKASIELYLSNKYKIDAWKKVNP